MTARTVPALAMALLTDSPELRGAFMSLNSAVQQISLGFGAVAAGKIIVEHGHELSRFELCGVLSAAVSLLCVYFAVRRHD
jgi:predicted MFS family arabinose efflux permease